MVAGAIGCAIHGLHREYRQYLDYRKTARALERDLRGGGKVSLADAAVDELIDDTGTRPALRVRADE